MWDQRPSQPLRYVTLNRVRRKMYLYNQCNPEKGLLWITECNSDATDLITLYIWFYSGTLVFSQVKLSTTI